MEIEQLGQIVSYIITVVIGGVGYKYASLWLGHKETNQNRESDDTQKLIENLHDTLTSLTQRVNYLEKQKNEAHTREIKLITQVSELKAEVKILQEKNILLDREISAYKTIINHYEGLVAPEKKITKEDISE